MDDSDTALVSRTLTGEPDAFAELVQRHRPGLVRTVALLIWDEDEAENLAQEAVTRALAQLADFRRDLSFRAWLHGIALNLCRNHLRDRGRRARPMAPDQLGGMPLRARPSQGVLSGILRQEAGERAAQAIGSLPELLREAFVLHFIEGLNYAEIGRITGLAAGTLRVRAHRARTLLRDSLGSVVDTWMREGRRDTE